MNTTAPASRRTAFLLLALATLFWAGNWVLGRALRDVFEPAALNFWRWLIALVALAPFALPGVRANITAIRRSAGLLLALSFFGVALFQWMIYEGLKTTTAVNAVLINSSFPAFMLLCSWAIERERGTRRQIVGMLISLAGILVIMARGDPASLVRLEFHLGDALILLAMPVWGVYSVLLKRRPPELDGIAFLFVISLVGTVLILPAFCAGGLVFPAAVARAAGRRRGALRRLGSVRSRLHLLEPRRGDRRRQCGGLHPPPAARLRHAARHRVPRRILPSLSRGGYRDDPGRRGRRHRRGAAASRAVETGLPRPG